MTQLVGAFLYFLFSYLIADKLGRTRSLGFRGAFLCCLILSPFLGLLITMSWSVANPRGCGWCDNKENEAEYCGLCGKNVQGELWENHHTKK